MKSTSKREKEAKAQFHKFILQARKNGFMFFAVVTNERLNVGMFDEKLGETYVFVSMDVTEIDDFIGVEGKH